VSTLRTACAEIEREAAYWEERRRSRQAHRLKMREIDDLMGELEELLLVGQREVSGGLLARGQRLAVEVVHSQPPPFTVTPVQTLALIDFLYELQSEVLADAEIDPAVRAADSEVEAEPQASSAVAP
jgi:hypothetical protein